ncbi:MAG: hypothetical protein R3C16_01515 [Hyphomonadaceae bacterium]
MDGVNNAGPTRDIEVVGFGKSEMDDLILSGRRRRAPRRAGFRARGRLFLSLGPSPLCTTGYSGALHFKRHRHDRGGEARGRALNNDYTAHRYHKPSDELTPDWDMSGGAQDVALLYAVGREIAEGSRWPQWRANAEFRAAREASGR